MRGREKCPAQIMFLHACVSRAHAVMWSFLILCRVLQLSYNQLSGTLPITVGSLVHLLCVYAKSVVFADSLVCHLFVSRHVVITWLLSTYGPTSVVFCRELNVANNDMVGYIPNQLAAALQLRYVAGLHRCLSQLPRDCFL